MDAFERVRATLNFETVDYAPLFDQFWGGFANAGQTCTGVERIFVQEGIYDRFVELLAEKARRIVTPDKHEDGADERDLTMGSMTTERQLAEVERQIADARAKGATILTGGERVGDSMVFPPTVVIDVDTSMMIQTDGVDLR